MDKSTTQARPRLATHNLDLPCICDVCGKARSARDHQRCSQIRQQRKNAEWASYMDNVAAKKALGARRYAR